jgi:4-diphosphocytidyl-2-C-methyl-D-erythritol kinase
MTVERTDRIRIRTNAKVNLFLRVMGLRADGFHEVENILHGVKLADEIEFRVTSTGRIEVDMRVEDDILGEVPAPELNLVYAAAQSLIEKGARNEGILIEVTKRIPMGAGLGGGSGNAAGALVLLNEIWKMDIQDADMSLLAASVGSDVPYCVGGGTALAKGRGEQLTRLPGPEDLNIVLGISHPSLSTTEVYKAWDEVGKTPSDINSAPMTMALGSGNPHDIASLLHNDLEAAAFALRPELEDKKKALLDAGALGASLSGSGPTLYAIASDESHARSIAARIVDDFDRIHVVTSQAHCIERL